METKTCGEVFLAGGARTPFGRFGGALRDHTLAELGSVAGAEALSRAGLSPAAVDQVVLGNVLAVTADGPFASRKIALDLGMREETRGLSVNRACGTGLQAIASAATDIAIGQSQVGLAVGCEVFSGAPYALRTRWGPRRGAPTIEDQLDWVYTDPWGNVMGATGQRLAEVAGISRERQDAYALESQQRTARAQQSGYLAAEIVGVEDFAQDEFPRPDTTLEALAELRPSFSADGSVTAGNSSGINDGAAAIAVLSASGLDEHGVSARARIVDWAVSGVEPELMGRGPVPATEAVLARTGLQVAEIDVFEVNEAFASVVLNAIDRLGLPHELTNINGGAISLGHPPGATGLRMVLAALNELDRREGRYALITMCLGGGQGMSMVLERVAE